MTYLECHQYNYTEYGVPLCLTKYLEKEDNIFVWKAALQNLEVDNWELILSDYELYPVLKGYFLPRISRVYHHYAYLIRQSFDVWTLSSSVSAGIETIFNIACRFGLRDCLNLASDIFTKWMNNPSPDFPVCLSKTICCYGIQLGSEKEWDFTWKMYKQNDTYQGTKYNLFSSLSCTHEPWLLQRFLHYVLNDSAISSFLIKHVIKNVARNKVGHQIALKFVTDNWSHLYNRSEFNALHGVMSSDITSSEVQMLQVFLNNTLEPEKSIMATKMMLSDKNETEERKQSLTKMIKWLKKNMDC